MEPKLTKAEYLKGYQIRLVFDDGTEGVVDLESELWGEVFEPLKNIDVFCEFTLNPDLATLGWPNGADFAPEFLYEKAKAA